MKVLSLSFIVLFLTNSLIFSQNKIPTNPQPILHTGHEPCGFDHIHNQALANDPLYLQKTQDFNKMVHNYTQDKSVATYVIPVVVHVMETGTNMSKITDQQIRDAITGLNARLRKLAGSLGDGNGVDTQIEYALAVRDPNGNCTNGIVRVNMTGNATYMSSGVRASTTTGITEATLKATSVWDQSRYYNMWFVSEIDGNNGSYGVQGYAYFASSHGTSLDGAVMTVNTILNPAGTTLIHELGHSLNLYHTFEGDGSGNTCPSNSSCSTQGDRVCDTPPHKRSNSTCTVGTNSCDGNSSTNLFIHNYMDYSTDECQNMFTAGQQTRMLAAISTTRASFLESNGNMALVPVSAPTADLYVSRSIMCSLGQAVKFYDISSCSPNTYMAETAWAGASYSWSITNNSGTTYTSTVQNPIITFAVAGVYDVTFTVTTSQGSSTVTKQGVVVVGSTSAATACTPSSTNNDNYGSTLSNVSLNTLNVSTSIFINSGYTDNSCTYNTVVAPGKTYVMSVTVNSAGSGAEVFEAYIDYNNDGDFLDAGEQVLTGSAANNASATITGNVTIPAGATQDRPLRMRVYAEAGTLSTNEKACSASMSIGDVEDYSIYVSSKVASVSIAAAPGTTTTYGTSVTFTATPTNGGTTPTYAWYKNGVLIAGATASTYVTSTLVNADKIYCIMTSNLANVIASPATSNTLTMTVTGVPQSDFTANTTVGCTSTSFAFTDASKLAPTSWAWTFTGGSPASSTAQNPTVTYASAGTYAVTLTASNANGTGTTMTKTGYITVTAAPATACTPTRSLTPANGVGITNVSLNTIRNTTANNDAVALNLTCSKSTTLTAGSTYTISVMGSTTVSQWTRVYIDYNNDGDFADANESVWSPANGVGTKSGSFTVPVSTTFNTALRMRVISDDLTTTPGSCTTPLRYGQAEDYAVLIVPGCAPVTPAVSIASSDADNSFCSGTSVTFTATPTNGGTTPAYQWKVNGGNVGTNSATFVSTTLANNDAVTCVLTSNDACASPTTATSSAITNTVTTSVTPSVSIASSDADNTICTGTSVTFTATPTNGGASPSYQWKLNGGNVGTNSATYVNAALANGDAVTCVMTSNATCASPATGTSSGITTTVNAIVTPSVSIASSDADNTICAGTSVTFTATPTNGGASPSYQWKLNGGNVGTNSATYVNAALANGDAVSCVMTSNNACASPVTGTSTGITTTVNTTVTPSVAIASSDADNIICAGTSVTFTATPTNGGASPSYQWKLNGGNVGTNSATYVNSGLTNGQTVTCVMTSNATCASPTTGTSSGITTTVNAIVTPSVSIASSDADNTICTGTSVTFTATPVNGGSTPVYQWYLNGSPVGTNSNSYTSSSLSNGQNITCDLTSNAVCASSSSASSSAIATSVLGYPVVDAPSNLTACDSYQLPALSSGNYFTGSGGTGTALFAGNNITSSQTIYVYASNGSCSSENSFAVTIYDCSQLASGSCGKNLTTMDEALYSEAVAGATNYRYWVQHASGYNQISVKGNGDNLFRMSWLTTPAKYATTYSVRVSAFVAGAWQPYGAPCNVTTPLTKLQTAQCGTVLANLTDAIYCFPVTDATNYRFWVTESVSGFDKISYSNSATNNFFRLSWFSSGIQAGKTYTVVAAAYVSGAWIPYGAACTITTPSALTQLSAASCNISVPALSTALYSDAVPGATNFRYEVVAPGFNKVSVRGASDNLFRLSWVSGIQLNKTYTIRVSAYLNGVWQAYGQACTVTTPAALMENDAVVQEHNNDLSLGTELVLETFPNPNNGSFTLRSNTAGRFQLTNELGQVIRTIVVSEENFETQVEGLSPGIYFINTSKIVVQ